MTWNRARAKGAAREGGDKGLKRAADHLLDVSQKLVPVDTGDTKQSGDSGLLSEGVAAVVYTDSKSIGLHENMQDHHRAGKRAKYLEQPLHSEHAKLLALIAESVRGEFH